MHALDERIDQVEDRVEDLGEFLAQLARQVATVNASTRRLEESAKAREESAKALEQSTKALERSIDRLGEQAEVDRHKWEDERRQDRREWREQFERDRQEWKRERRKLAQELGDIARKQGTLVEDIVAPSLRRMAAEELGCGPVEFSAPRVEQRQPGDRSKRREFDFLYVGRDAVLLNETKSTARPQYAKDFVDFLRSGEFVLYFPQCADRPLVPVFSSLYVPDEVVAYLTKHGVYALGMGDEAMAVLNLEEVRGQAQGDTVKG